MFCLLKTYEDFVLYVDNNGFMPLSTNKAGLPSLSSLTEENAWHTNEVTDPWLWRKQIADDKRAAYSKVFEKKPGFISLSCYPCFLALRRGGAAVADLYGEGKLSLMAKAVYELFEEHAEIPAHDIMQLLGAGKDRKNEVDNALLDLQMHMFVTISGTVRKTNSRGEEYGWPSVIYQSVEKWVSPEILKATGMSSDEAKAILLGKARQVKPDVDEKRLLKCILLAD